MTIKFDFTLIDAFINNIGSTIEVFVTFLILVFNTFNIILLFCVFIGLLYAVIKIFDMKRYAKRSHRQ